MPDAKQQEQAMINWGTYGTREEAERRIAESGYPPGRLSWERCIDGRSGRAIWVVRLTYDRHLTQVGASANKRNGAIKGGD